MKFFDLKGFITSRMRMSHIYQPLMLMTLLRNNGRCTARQIAKEILKYDSAQIEYYEKIVHNMVGRVLRRHGIVDRDELHYVLNDVEKLKDAQVEELLQLCRQKLETYLEKRGNRVFAHRNLANGYITGTLRYEILKAAKFHCELCGVSADEKALEVDHIVPRNHGGTDDLQNLQALCYSCNAMKRDRDSTDFRKVRLSYSERHTGCLFCEIPTARVIASNTLAYAIEDAYAVTALHSLVIPKRHVPTYFELGRPEINACNSLLEEMRVRISGLDDAVEAFNIGMNCGGAAGQTIFHCHIHLIPRRNGDVENPRGGVRHVIPGKGVY